jgi:pimeloyl-ACP methyl ester carboxylesterase
VLVGTHDRLTPVRTARRIADVVPAELTIYPEAGHMLPLERVAGVAARISALVTAALAAIS